MSIGTKRNSVNCTVCGAEVRGPFHGRIPEYCSKECREFRKYLNAAARSMMAIQFDAEHLSKTRSELFTLSNQLKRPSCADRNEAMRGAGAQGGTQ